MATEEGRARRLPHLLLATLLIAHVVVALALLPDWLFSKYPDAALLLRSGKLAAEEGADFSPFYLLLNATLAPQVLRVLQTLAGASAIAAVFFWWDHKGQPWRGLLGAALLSLCAALPAYEATLEPDVWIAVLAIWTLVVLEAARPDRTSGAVFLGILGGVALALRPSNALWFLAALAVFCRRAHFSRQVLVRAAASAGVAAVLFFASSAAVRGSLDRNASATMSVGTVIHMGNRPESPGLGAHPSRFTKLLELQLRSAARPDYAHALYRRIARAAEGEDASAARAESYWLRQTLQYVAKEPLAFARLQGRKLVFFFFGPDGHDLAEVRRAELKLAPLPLLRTEWLLLLGVAAAVFALRRPGLGVAMAFAASFVAMGCVFYVVARYRLAVVPLACLLAASALPAREALKAPRTWAPFALAVLLLCGTALPLVSGAREVLARAQAASAAGAKLDTARRAADPSGVAAAWVELQAAQPFAAWVRDLREVPFEDPALATQAGQRALEQWGAETGASLTFAAELAARAGRCDGALSAARAAAETGFRWSIFDGLVDPLLIAARCELAAGRGAQALADARESLSRTPGTLDGLAAAVALSPEPDEPRRGELFTLHDPPSAQYALARWSNDAGKAAQGLAAADAVLALIPESAAARYERARALALAGRSEEALAELDQALLRDPWRGWPMRPFDTAVALVVAREPTTPALWAAAAEHAFREGDVGAASSRAERAAVLFGASAPTWMGQRLALYRRWAR